MCNFIATSLPYTHNVGQYSCLVIQGTIFWRTFVTWPRAPFTREVEEILLPAYIRPWRIWRWFRTMCGFNSCWPHDATSVCSSRIFSSLRRALAKPARRSVISNLHERTIFHVQYYVSCEHWVCGFWSFTRLIKDRSVFVHSTGRISVIFHLIFKPMELYGIRGSLLMLCVGMTEAAVQRHIVQLQPSHLYGPVYTRTFELFDSHHGWVTYILKIENACLFLCVSRTRTMDKSDNVPIWIQTYFFAYQRNFFFAHDRAQLHQRRTQNRRGIPPRLPP